MTQAFKIPKEGHPIIMKVKAYHKYMNRIEAQDRFFFYKLEEQPLGMGTIVNKGNKLITKGRVSLGPNVALYRDEGDLPSTKTVWQSILGMFSKDKKV